KFTPPTYLTTFPSTTLFRSLALLSLLSTLFHDAWFEKLVQPAAGFELTRQYPPRRCNPRGDDPAAPRPFANGQFMLFDAAAYRRSEEHTSEFQSRENLVCRL